MADGEDDPIFICSALPMKSLLFTPYSSFWILLHKCRHSVSGVAHVTIVNGEEGFSVFLEANGKKDGMATICYQTTAYEPFQRAAPRERGLNCQVPRDIADSVIF